MASGDENESLGYAGYMWEPEYSKEELFERLSDTEDGGDIGQKCRPYMVHLQFLRIDAKPQRKNMLPRI